MKKIMLALLICSCQLGFSQTVEVVSKEKLPVSLEKDVAYAKMSPAGDFVLVTSASKGIQKYDFSDKSVKSVSNARVADFDPTILEDGSVVYREAVYGKDHKRMTAYKAVKANGENLTIQKAAREVYGISAKGNTVATINANKVSLKSVNEEKAQDVVACGTKDGQLLCSYNGKVKAIYPLKDGTHYLWASMSPDGTKIAFYAMEYGKTFVCDVYGNNVVQMGTMRAPKWMGNDWVVGMYDEDNGLAITKALVVVASADGKKIQALTSDSEIAMYPSASADAKKIAYSDDKGNVYVMDVTVK